MITGGTSCELQNVWLGIMGVSPRLQSGHGGEAEEETSGAKANVAYDASEPEREEVHDCSLSNYKPCRALRDRRR